jgi:hypothetical protein
MMSLLLAGCSSQGESMNLIIILPDGFRGFGPIYHSKSTSDEKISHFEVDEDTATVFVDTTGGV